jgi:hypothetical protein
MRHIQSIIAIILAAVMLLPVLFSCAEKDAGVGSTDETTPAVTETETADPRDIDDGLPDVQFDGATFTLFCREEAFDQYFSEQTGEVVDDAIYTRNLKVEEDYSIKLQKFTMNGTWSNMTAYRKAISGAVLSGDQSFDLVEGDCAIADLLGNNYFCNWNEFEYFNPDQPWWAKASNKELNVGGKLEFIVGDYTLMLWEGLLVIYFNKQLAKDLPGIEDPYSLVTGNEWTIDKLAEISRTIAQDLNGDSKFDEKDRYGLITTTGNCIDNFWISSDMPITVMDEDGFPMFNLPQQSERALAVTEKVYNLVKGTGVYAIDEGKVADTLQPMFMDGRGLFFTDFLKGAEVYRTMETDFGIIPYPKFDENQEKYETFSKTGYGTFAIPSVARDPEFSCIITVALNAESYKQVVPAYYEVALKTKYSRDDESQAMLDIIREGFDMDFSCVCLDNTSWFLLEMRYMIQGNSFDMASRIAKKKKTISKLLEKLKKNIREQMEQ